MTCYLPVFTRENGQLREAVCGTWIRLTEHSRTPTCPRCQAWLLSMDDEVFDPPMVASVDVPIPPDRCPAALGRRHDFSMRGSDGQRRCWHCCQSREQVEDATEAKGAA